MTQAMQMKIHGHPVSIMTFQVLHLLAEKEIDAEFVIVDLYAKEQKKPAHLARHPFGHVPVLEAAEFVLYEAPAILRYLDRRAPTFKPVGDRARARMDQWLCNEQAYLKPVIGKLFARLAASILGREDPCDAIVEEGMRDAVRVLDVMERQLEETPWLAGESFSLADLAWGAYFPRLLQAGCDYLIEEHETIALWWRRVGERPAFQQTQQRLDALLGANT